MTPLEIAKQVFEALEKIRNDLLNCPTLPDDYKDISLEDIDDSWAASSLFCVKLCEQALTHAPELLKWCEDLETALSKLRPFSVVQGDAVNRLNPSSQLKVNSNDAWVVSEGNRSAHKLVPLAKILNGESPPTPAGE